MSEEVESVYSSFNGFLKKKKSGVKTEPQKNSEVEDINVNADALIEGKEEEGEEVKSFLNQNVRNNNEEETPPESKEISEEEKEESSEESEADKESSEDDEEKETENDSQSSEGGEENEGESDGEESQESPLTRRMEEYLSNGDEDEEDDDDDEYLSPEEEKLYYSSDENSVSFDDLNNNKEDDEDDDEDDDAPPPKMDISQLTGSKKKFMSGKPKKGLILGVLGGIFAFLFLTLEAKKIVSERKEAQEASKKVQTINTGEYSPDFGDYEARAYKPTAIDQAASEANYTEALLNSGEKRPFEEETAVNKGNTSPSYQPSSSSSQGGGGGSSSWNDAMTSPIRYQGFNGSTGSQGLLDTLAQGQGNYYPQGYSASYNPVTGYAQGYGEILESLTGQNGNQGQVSQNNRQFTAGQGSGTNQASYQQIPENSIYPGTIIHAVMVSGINTDYPAPITARVIENVYDSKTGKKLLIPSGSILRGSYSSASLGVNRVEIAWTELVINRDNKDWIVNLGNMAGVDRSGYSGIKGTLNEHAFAYVKAMGWASLFTYMNSNIYTYTKAQKSQTQRQMIEDSQDIANRLTDRILDRALDIEPTIRVKPGTKVSVAVDRVVTLNPYSQDVPVKKYVRK